MLQGLLDCFKGDSSCRLQKKRLRRMAEASVKVCGFCRANVSCDLQVCENCLSPFAKGLGNEKWLASARENNGRMSDIDRVKYQAGACVERLVDEGRKTLQRMSLSARFKTT